MHGIPVALKDNIMTKDDMPTSGGMLAFKHYMAPYDATLVANLKAAGAIIIAKAGTPLAKLGPLAANEQRTRRLGCLAGCITIPSNFDAPLPDHVIDAFEGR